MISREPWRRRLRGSSVLDLLVLLVLFGFVTSWVVVLFKNPPQRNAAEQVTPASPPPVEATAVDSSATGLSALVTANGDLSTLGWILAGLVIVVALGFVLKAAGQVGRGITEAIMDIRDDQRRRKGASAPATASELTELRSRHLELSALYGTYLTDPVEVLRRPILNDMTNHCTAEFVEAYAALNAIVVDDRSGDQVLARYRDAVTNAWKAWRAADAEATRVGASNFSAEDQKRIRRAIDLLNLAADGATTPFEREQALKQAHKLIDGLVVLPGETALALHGPVRTAIEA